MKQGRIRTQVSLNIIYSLNAFSYLNLLIDSVENAKHNKRKKGSSSVIRLGQREQKSSTSSFSAKKERTREHGVASTSTFVANNINDPTYLTSKIVVLIYLVKHKKRLEVTDEDLDVEILDDEGNQRRKRNEKVNKNAWFNDHSSGRGITIHTNSLGDNLEDLQSRSDGSQSEKRHKKVKREK